MFNLATTQTVQTMTSLEIAELCAMRHDNVLRDCRRMFDELGLLALNFEVKRKVVISNGSSRESVVYALDMELTLTLVSGYNIKLRNAVIKRWQVLEQSNVLGTKPDPAATLLLVRTASELLNMCTAAKLLALQKACVHLNVPTDLLPNYGIVTTPDADVQSSKPAHALTHHLKAHNIPITPIAVNKLLEAAGYLETKTREGKSGQEKRYKSVTQKGLAYGYNMTSPQQQRQTQPYWFDDTFTELMADVGVYQA